MSMASYIYIICTVQSVEGSPESTDVPKEEPLPEELPESICVVGIDDNIHSKALQRVIDQVRSKYHYLYIIIIAHNTTHLYIYNYYRRSFLQFPPMLSWACPL